MEETIHPLIAIPVLFVGSTIMFWLALAVYGLIRKDKKSDSRRSRVRLTEEGGGADGGGGDGGGH
jgi:hypothetical protein